MKPTALLLGVLLCFLLPTVAHAQCQIQVFTNYAVSTSVTVNSDLTHILTSVLEDGSATMSMSYPCPDSIINSFNQGKANITHYASVQNQIGSVGGWTAAPSFCAECYESFQTNADSGPLAPNQTVNFTANTQITCSTAGAIFNPPALLHSYSIRLSAYVFAGLSNLRCAWSPTCTGTCSSPHTTNTNQYGTCWTTGIYKQCADLLQDGKCWSPRVLCYGKAAPGICS